MMEGMMASLLGSLGIDPKTLLAQAEGIGKGFARIELGIGQLLTNQRAIMAHLGMADLPPMTAEEEAAAVSGTAAYIEGLARQAEGKAANLLLGSPTS